MVAEQGLPGDDQGFGSLIQAHRRDVVVLCYRFLGSLHEAEEAAQETAIRAWRGRESFRGEASVRTWLHRIATRVCLDALDQRRRRPVTVELGPPSDPADPPAPPSPGASWVQPLPDAFIADIGEDPAARYSVRESVSLAFLVAVQSLPARSRAVLILRDVLGWSAAETAACLQMSVPAVNSALHRARLAVEAGRPSGGLEAVPVEGLADPRVRGLVEAYVHAWESDDVPGLVAVLRSDVRLAMPPSPSWYLGRDAVGAFIERWVFGSGLRGRFRMEATTANGQAAVLMWERGAGDAWALTGLHVLTIGAGGISEILVSMDPAVVERFRP